MRPVHGVRLSRARVGAGDNCRHGAGRVLAVMDTWDEDGDGVNRQSPMAYNGGLKLGRAPAPPAEWRDYRDRPARQRPAREHVTRDNTHPPLACPRPRFNEPWRGYRCPACGRPMHHELNVYDAHETADRALATIGRAAVACYRLVRDLPRWAELVVGLVLTVAPVLGWLAANGWMGWA